MVDETQFSTLEAYLGLTVFFSLSRFRYHTRPTRISDRHHITPRICQLAERSGCRVRSVYIFSCLS